MRNAFIAVAAAIPVGWGAGLLAAYLLSAGNIGRLPAFTIPIGLLAAIAYALLPLGPTEQRRNVLLIGAGLFMALGVITS